MRNLRDIFLLKESVQSNFHLDVAMENLRDGNSERAFDHVNSLIYEELSKLEDIDTSISLFRFTGIPDIGTPNDNPVIKDIELGRITLGNPDQFNDPMDPILREWAKLQIKSSKDKYEKDLFKIAQQALQRLRIGCLVKTGDIGNDETKIESSGDINECDLLMWAHYADSHKGICIKYRIDSDTLSHHNDNQQLLKIGNVRYRGYKVMSDYITLDNALLAKADCWNMKKKHV